MANDEVIGLGLPWLPDPGAPAPLLWKTDHETVLVYRPARSTGRAGDRVILRFGGCLVAQFGYPSDEALSGHPLHSHGLGSYDIFEVLSSGWIERLRQQNLVSFPDATWWPAAAPDAVGAQSPDPARPTAPDRPRHFIVTFHDNTFECVAETIEGEFTGLSLDAIVATLTATRSGDRRNSRSS